MLRLDYLMEARVRQQAFEKAGFYRLAVMAGTCSVETYQDFGRAAALFVATSMDFSAAN
jgi:hypothetical protein